MDGFKAERQSNEHEEQEHRRLNALGMPTEHLIVVALPDAGGVRALVLDVPTTAPPPDALTVAAVLLAGLLAGGGGQGKL